MRRTRLMPAALAASLLILMALVTSGDIPINCGELYDTCRNEGWPWWICMYLCSANVSAH